MGPNLPLFFFSFFLHRLTWTWHLEEWKDGFKIYVSRFRADWCTWDGDGEEFSVDAGRVARWCPCMRERTVTPLKPRRTNPTGRPPSLTCSGGAAPAGGLAAGATLKAPFWGMRHIHWVTLSCCLRASFPPTLPKHESKRLTRLKEVYCELLYFGGGLYRQMWLLGSTSQVMMMDERLSPSARSVQSPGDNPSTIHSIEAILGFKEDGIFHKAASYSLTDKVLVKEAERNVIVTPMKKSPSSESFDSKFPSRFHEQINQMKCKDKLKTCPAILIIQA